MSNTLVQDKQRYVEYLVQQFDQMFDEYSHKVMFGAPMLTISSIQEKMYSLSKELVLESHFLACYETGKSSDEQEIAKNIQEMKTLLDNYFMLVRPSAGQA